MNKLPDLRNFITFRTSRSGGKGGQHVNKTESKAELVFDFVNCDLFKEHEYNRILSRIRNKLNQEGELIIVSEKYRSQVSNKEDAFKKLEKLLVLALVPEKKRVKTKPSRASLEKKKESKRKLSEKKQQRRKPLL